MGKFDERLKATNLLSTAKLHLLDLLSEKTKTLPAKRPDMEEIIQASINYTEYGSTETLGVMIKRF